MLSVFLSSSSFSLIRHSHRIHTPNIENIKFFSFTRKYETYRFFVPHPLCVCLFTEFNWKSNLYGLRKVLFAFNFDAKFFVGWSAYTALQRNEEWKDVKLYLRGAASFTIKRDLLVVNYFFATHLSHWTWRVESEKINFFFFVFRFNLIKCGCFFFSVPHAHCCWMLSWLHFICKSKANSLLLMTNANKWGKLLGIILKLRFREKCLSGRERARRKLRLQKFYHQSNIKIKQILKHKVNTTNSSTLLFHAKRLSCDGCRVQLLIELQQKSSGAKKKQKKRCF